MKKTQRLDLLTTIRGSIVSFFAITMFVALGVGLFLGIHWIAGAMYGMADAQFAAGNAHNVEITFPYGLTDDDLKQLSALEGVDEIDAGYLAYQEMTAGTRKLVVRLGSLPHTIDTFVEVEGELPTTADQIALESTWAERYDLSIGDTIKFLPDLSADEDDIDSLDFSATKASDASKDSAKTKKEDEADLKSSDKDGMRYLNGGTYTVTALVKSPAYLATNSNTYGVCTLGSGAIDGIAWVTDDAFDPAAFRDGKPYVLVHSSALDGLSTNSTTYKEASDALEARVKELGDRLGDERFNDIYSTAKAKLDEGQAAYDEKEAEVEQSHEAIKKGEQELEEGRTTLAERTKTGAEELERARKLLDDGRAAYDSALAQLNEKRNEFAAAEAQYYNALASVNAAQGALNNLRGQYSALNAQLADGTITQEEYDAQLSSACAQAQSVINSYGVPYSVTPANVEGSLAQGQGYIDQMRNRPFTMAGQTVTLNTAGPIIENARAQIASTSATLYQKAQELAAGEAEWANAKQTYETEIEEGKKRIEQGEIELEEGKAQVAEAEEVLAEAEEQLEKGRTMLSGLVDYSWVVLPRFFNGAVVAMDSYTGVTANLRWSMASLFLVVGILVCYSAVSRLVHEQITRIGTKKAVGFRPREINGLFLWYAALCVIVGAVLGCLLAVFLVENILLSSMGNRFVMPTGFYFNPLDALLITLLEFVLILGATWFAVSGVLKMQAVELLAGEKPPTAKARFYEKWGVWQRMGLLAQTTINNCINDTRRVVGTLVGVAGCTALIVCAVTLNDNVVRSFTRQYDAINHYDTMVTVVPETDAATKGPGLLEAQGMETTTVFSQRLTLEQPDGTRSTVTVFVPLEDDFDDFFSRVATGGTPSEDGVWVSEAYHEHLGAEVGDQITISDTTGKQHSWNIAGFFEYHLLNHQMVLPADEYTEAFGVEPQANRILVRTDDATAEDVVGILKNQDGYVSTVDDYANNERGFTEFSSIARIVVAVYLVLAAVMAACVLLNLDFMFVDEKKRELIVLMICGYSLKDAKGYIWHDSVVLTALGIVCGLLLGNVVGGLTIRSIEQANSSFLHGVSWLAVGAGVAGSVVLAAAALVIALRRINKFDLTDINRF